MSGEKLFDELPEAMNRIGKDYVVLSQNRRSRKLFGDVTSRFCHEAFFGRDSPCPGCQLPELVRRQRSGTWYVTDERGKTPTYFEVTLAPVVDEDRIEEVVEILRDATVKLGVEQHLIQNSERMEEEALERREELRTLSARASALRAEMQELREDQAAMVNTEKMASLGRLAAGLTHEIHTPLGALISNLDMVERCVKKLSELVPPGAEKIDAAQLQQARKLLDNGLQLLELQRLAATRIHKIVRSLREFAHLDRAILEDYDLREGLDATISLLAHETRGRIDVEREYAEIPRVRCRPDAINQVFMNLLQNAVHAIDDKGKISVRAKVEGKHVLVEVEDTGRGIAPENLDNIFEPGFTTKPRGVGTGLGLAIAYSTVTGQGGSINVASTVGEGTRFSVRLPIEPPAAKE